VVTRRQPVRRHRLSRCASRRKIAVEIGDRHEDVTGHGRCICIGCSDETAGRPAADAS
jgi:hypothetical protein